MKEGPLAQSIFEVGFTYMLFLFWKPNAWIRPRSATGLGGHPVQAIIWHLAREEALHAAPANATMGRCSGECDPHPLHVVAVRIDLVCVCTTRLQSILGESISGTAWENGFSNSSVSIRSELQIMLRTGM